MHVLAVPASGCIEAVGGPVTLAAALSRLPAPETAWDSRISLGLPDAAMRLSDLGAGGAALVGLVAVKRAQAPGGDDRLGCAYLVGELGHIIGTLLGGLWLAGWHVTGADCAAIALTLPRLMGFVD